MARQAEFESLEKHAEAVILSFKPEEEECDCMSHGKKYTILTPKAGEVAFMIDRDDNVRGECATISIFARFENHLAARALGFDSNQFSGKWNHHFIFSKKSVDAIFEELKQLAF